MAISKSIFRVSDSFMFSAFRIWDFMGRRYVPLSGKIEVFQFEFPRVTFTGREPQPRVYMPKLSLIISAVSFSIRTKNQAPLPVHLKILAFILYSLFLIIHPNDLSDVIIRILAFNKFY